MKLLQLQMDPGNSVEKESSPDLDGGDSYHYHQKQNNNFISHKIMDEQLLPIEPSQNEIDQSEIHVNCSLSSTNFHRTLNIKNEFNLIRTLSKSNFGKVILGKKDDEKMVLKVFSTKLVSWDDFQKELNYNYFLSPHPNIVTSFNVSFEWKNSYIFVQEFAPFGDLTSFMSNKQNILTEPTIKLIVQQLASALDFMHGVHLVHGDVLLENVLVFKQDCSLVKLCDFGSTEPEGTLMVRRVSLGHATQSTFPPEICDIIPQEKYYSSPSSDVWQLGICTLTLLTGGAPWQVADITDSNYSQYIDWLKRKSFRVPESFKSFSPRFMRLMKRLLEPKEAKRAPAREVFKYMKDAWIEKQCGFIVGGCRKCPSNSSVGKGNNRKESSASTASGEQRAEHKQRSVSPCHSTHSISNNTGTGGPVISTKLIIGPQPTITTTTTTSGTTSAYDATTTTMMVSGGRTKRAKSLKSSASESSAVVRRHHTFRDISPATTAKESSTCTTKTNSSSGSRSGYAMRRCTSHEIKRTPSISRKNS